MSRTSMMGTIGDNAHKLKGGKKNNKPHRVHSLLHFNSKSLFSDEKPPALMFPTQTV